MCVLFTLKFMGTSRGINGEIEDFLIVIDKSHIRDRVPVFSAILVLYPGQNVNMKTIPSADKREYIVFYELCNFCSPFASVDGSITNRSYNLKMI